MITVSNVSLNFGGTNLFKDVNLKFTPGNCYGIIGANGAGKSTFLKILSGELEPSTGEVTIPKEMRMSILKQNHFAYNDFSIMDTVIMGNPRLYEIIQEKDALYSKPDFTEEDGIKASELEGEFAELNGWDAETDVSKLLSGLGLGDVDPYATLSTLNDRDKIKVLLAQALFGQPEIILLDEPTNHLDIQAIKWLEDFLMDYVGTVIVVSHDRHFLNNVCTHIVDIDYTKIKMYVGNTTRTKSARTRSRNCSPSSSASPPTNPRPSRRPPAASCSISSPWKKCPLPAENIPSSSSTWTEKPARKFSGSRASARRSTA